MSEFWGTRRTRGGLLRGMANELAAVVFALATIAAWIGGCGPTGAPSAASGGDAAIAAGRSGIGFRTLDLLQEHYRKHGREFGVVSPEGYLSIAQQLRDRPTGGDVLEITRNDGVVTRFDRGTGTFVAFDRDGVIRTCFRPRAGERYFRRQATRNEGGR